MYIVPLCWTHREIIKMNDSVRSRIQSRPPSDSLFIWETFKYLWLFYCCVSISVHLVCQTPSTEKWQPFLFTLFPANICCSNMSSMNLWPLEAPNKLAHLQTRTHFSQGKRGYVLSATSRFIDLLRVLLFLFHTHTCFWLLLLQKTEHVEMDGFPFNRNNLHPLYHLVMQTEWE